MQQTNFFSIKFRILGFRASKLLGIITRDKIKIHYRDNICKISSKACYAQAIIFGLLIAGASQSITFMRA